MLTSCRYLTHLLPFKLLSCTLITSTSSTAFPKPSSQTETRSSLALFGGPYFGCLIQLSWWAQPTIRRLMAKHSVLINVWKHFFGALCILAPFSGTNGFPWLNIGTIRHSILLWVTLHLRLCTVTHLTIWAWLILRTVLFLILPTGFRTGICLPILSSSSYYELSNGWSTRLTLIVLKKSMLLVI